jgi:hypothetical protein
MLWIPSTDSLHGLSGQLHALAALTRGEVVVLLESRLDVTQRQSRRFREEEYLPPPKGIEPRSLGRLTTGWEEHPTLPPAMLNDWQEGLR